VDELRVFFLKDVGFDKISPSPLFFFGYGTEQRGPDGQITMERSTKYWISKVFHAPYLRYILKLLKKSILS